MRYYYLAGLFPHNCSDDLFAENIEQGYLGKSYKTPEAAKTAFEGHHFLRIFEVRKDGTWKPVAGYAPNGSLINDDDWEYLSRLTYTMFMGLSQQEQVELIISGF